MDFITKRSAFIFLSALLSFAFCGCQKVPEETLLSDEVPFTLTVYDAGKGDAFLISSPEFNMMLDCGYKDDADEIIADMMNRNISSLDLLIISHFDKDHVGGASKIVKNFNIRRIITSPVTNDDKRTLKFLEALSEKGLKNEIPSSDIEIDEPGFRIRINSPARSDYPDSDDNNSSLLVKVESSCGSVLFTGDAESVRLEEMLSKDWLDSDVLKFPHHGKEAYKTEELLKKTSPLITILTSSDEEPADDRVTNILDMNGAKYYDTKDTGQFDIIFDKDGIRADVQ